MITPHLDFLWYFDLLAANPALFIPWKGDLVRQSVPRWLSEPYRFTGVGAALTGARWSVKQLMPAVYASTDPATLSAEANYKGQRYGWTQSDFKTQLIVGMHWELQKVLDLTAAATLAALKVQTKELLQCDWRAEQSGGTEPMTQAIARAAFENLAEGLVVPSARLPGGVNVVYFPTHRRAGTVIQMLDPASIPFAHGL